MRLALELLEDRGSTGMDAGCLGYLTGGPHTTIELPGAAFVCGDRASRLVNPLMMMRTVFLASVLPYEWKKSFLYSTVTRFAVQSLQILNPV